MASIIDTLDERTKAALRELGWTEQEIEHNFALTLGVAASLANRARDAAIDARLAELVRRQDQDEDQDEDEEKSATAVAVKAIYDMAEKATIEAAKALGELDVKIATLERELEAAKALHSL